MTKILYIDVDGVVVDLHTVWLGRYNPDYNDDLKVSDITSWGIHNFVKPECGHAVYNYIEDPSIYDDIPFIDGACDAIRKLSSKYRVVFATHSTMGTAGVKYRVLHRHSLLTSQNNYIELKDKSLLRGDYILDDYHVNVVNFSGLGFLFDAAWNQNISGNFTRVYGWEHFVSIMM